MIIDRAGECQAESLVGPVANLLAVATQPPIIFLFLQQCKF